MGEQRLHYSILDPTGNITAIVEDEVPVARQPEIAAAIMRRHPAVEQVGFLCTVDGTAALRMAGGEFCGNASMSAAALLLSHSGQRDGEATVRLRVSGAAQPVQVRLRPDGEARFAAEVRMPPALGITEEAFRFGDLSGKLPLVRLEGISHLVIEPSSVFFVLKDAPEAAEQAVREFCADLRAEGLGLLFLEGDGNDRHMTPLVYVPGSETVFWENACASGSAAVGLYLAARAAAATALTLREPGGTMRVCCDPARGETLLDGSVRLVERLELPFTEL